MMQSKIRRQKSAIQLAEERAKRTPEQQLDILDQRLGVGIGAKKERDRLWKQIELARMARRNAR